LRELFANPPAEFRPAPFWFWNARLERDEIERQIREMHAKGVGGFFIHGRFGLETDYLSSEWMGLVEHAVKIANELGMHAWLYDENPFPSGVGGGLIMRNRDYWCKFLDLIRRTVDGEESVELAIPEGKLISAVAVDLESRSISTDLMPHVSDGRLSWQSPAGKWEIMAFVERAAECPGFIYGSEPDYFEPGMVHEWFEITHEAYARRLGEYFGAGIEGIFTDEPKIQCIYHMHDDPFTTAWFHGLPELFRARSGYDLIPNLPALFTDFGPDPGKVRRDFWRLVGEEYVRRLFRPYHDWCERHNLKLTGHLFLEEGLYANTMYQGDFMEDMRWFDMPGTDHLGLTAESEYGIRVIPRSLTRIHGQKIVSSCSHIYARKRTLSETFGCAGWELSMAHMKWIVDWQLTLGINFLCPHAFYYSLAGVRKTDAPPSQFYQATFWKHYRTFADYVGRLSLVLSQGKHRAQAALLYPIESFHSEWAVGTQGPLDTFIAESYDFYCANLVKQHFDYDIVSEKAIQGAGVSTGRMKIAGEEYELLILPPVTAIALATMKKIEEFVRAGGKVLATGLLPAADAAPDGAGSPASEEIIGLVHEIFDREPTILREEFLSAYNEEKGPTLGLTSDGRAGFIACNRAHLIGKVLREAVESLIQPDIRVTCGGRECEAINALHRTTEFGEVYFFANTTGEPLDVEISLKAKGFPEQWDAETGAFRRITDFKVRGRRTILPWRFDSCGSMLLVLSSQESEAEPVPQPAKPGLPKIELSNTWRFRTESPNVLVLRDWKLEIDGSGDCSAYRHETTVNARFAPERAFLVLDDLRPGRHTQGSRIEVEVNGEPVDAPQPMLWMVDVNFPMMDISGRLREGENSIVLRIVHGGWSGPPKLMAAPQYLFGDFSLQQEGASFALVPPRTELTAGSWADQGYPFYSGTGIYSQTVRVPEEYAGRRLMLEVENPADMIEVWVNGHHAGARPWPPYAVDVSQHIRPGENEIEIRVTNSLANMLMSTPRPSGLLGKARLVAGDCSPILSGRRR